jgi:Sulfatase
LAGLISALTALSIGLLGSAACEALIKPESDRAGRPVSAWSVHVGSFILCFTVVLSILQRPLFSAALSLGLLLLLVTVNNAKFRALREPFVFSDFGLFSQAIRYPRLYIPFLDAVPTLAGCAVFGVIGYAGLTLEAPLAPAVGVQSFVGGILAGFALAFGLLRQGIRKSSPISLDPAEDLRRHGLLTSLWLYRTVERSAPIPLCQRYRRVDRQAVSASRSLPHLIVVQSESFFDARRLLPSIRKELLCSFDEASARGKSGRLGVPAWGANTMRTEFAFLSGMAPQHLGIDRFNPYRRMGRVPTPSLAGGLNALGYRTVCIHPHPAGFFGRDRVFPHLGFTDFVDIRAFDERAKFGPYIGDAAVTDQILQTIASADEPVFVFAITMENHGPLHLETTSREDRAALFVTEPPTGFDDLAVYLRHLKNADRMIAQLRKSLGEGCRDSVLCFFGDHVPSMPEVYEILDHRDPRTEYLIWNSGREVAEQMDIEVEDLGVLLLQSAGLNCGSEFLERSRPDR